MVTRLLHILLVLILLSGAVRSQTNSSPHQRDWEFYRDNPEMVGKAVALPALAKRTDLASPQVMDKVVYGFHPYWQNGQESNYYFSLLTHIAYFSADVDAATGNFSSTHSWSTANVVTLAQQYGVKVHLSVVLFSNHSTLLASTSAKNNLIANIMTQINLRNADGCNIDFESISGTQATAYRDFLKQLGDTLKAHNKEFVVELFAVDWNTVFPASFFSTLNSVVDYYFIMLYDYYYSGSTTAGPVAPLMNTTSTSYRHVLRSIKAYTDVGAPANKLIAGFPSYGYDWPVVSNVRMASATADAVSRTYTISKNNYLDTITAGDKFRDATFNVPWYRYQSGGTWRQVWYDDSLSWAKKFDSIKVKSVAGTGMWALGYDGTEPELWGALKNAFAQTADPLHTSFDNFESTTGHFYTAPTFSGTTAGISKLSTAALTNDAANNGAQSLMVTIKDSTTIATSWTVRLLSGSGTVGNNTSFGTTGYFGMWIKSTSSKSGLQVALSVDDGPGGTLISSKKSITADGTWRLYEWNLASTTWTILAGADNVLNGPNATLDAVMLYANNDASDWTLYLDDVSRNAAGPLPVELVSFSAHRSSSGIQLSWSTATETDNYGFDLERKITSSIVIDSMNQWINESIPRWQPIAFVPGYGTSNSPRAYLFTDASASSAAQVYRLRQIDRSGAFQYSAELTVGSSVAPGTFALEQNYPNPFNPVTAVSYQLSVPGMTTLTVYDMLGREVATLVNDLQQPGRHTVSFNASNLSSGVYFYTLRSGSFSQSRRMLLIK
jgi:spore germination protein YaaH